MTVYMRFGGVVVRELENRNSFIGRGRAYTHSGKSSPSDVFPNSNFFASLLLHTFELVRQKIPLYSRADVVLNL
jgi:hypothetical protein